MGLLLDVFMGCLREEFSDKNDRPVSVRPTYTDRDRELGLELLKRRHLSIKTSKLLKRLDIDNMLVTSQCISGESVDGRRFTHRVPANIPYEDIPAFIGKKVPNIRIKRPM